MPTTFTKLSPAFNKKRPPLIYNKEEGKALVESDSSDDYYASGDTEILTRLALGGSRSYAFTYGQDEDIMLDYPEFPCYPTGVNQARVNLNQADKKQTNQQGER